MRGFALLTAVTLIAIGVGVGIEAPEPTGRTVHVSVRVSNLDPPGSMGKVQVEVRNTTTGEIQLSRPLATFEWDSGSHPEMVAAPGALWLFELETANGPMVWRISSSTGEVEQTTKVPRLVRQFLAAD